MRRTNAVALSTLILSTACGRTVLWPVGAGESDAGGSSNAVVADGGPWKGVVTTNKVDLLLMLDNSTSMVEKHAILSSALPDLVRQLAGVEDLHVGVITSSLGGHGANTCEDKEDSNDHAELLGSRPRGKTSGLADFVEWRSADGIDALPGAIQSMVDSAGQSGCGLEAQLESTYRFLVDPFPPEDVVLVPCADRVDRCAMPVGIDQTILSQRKAFLRPDSALAIVLLSDENDCSIRDSLQYYYAATLDVLLPAAAGVCDADPNDPCCYSCGLSPPDGCAPDPVCGPPVPSLDESRDASNLRCFEQKRRFGIDFLYPVERYVNAFTKPMLCTTRIDLDANGECPARPDRFPGLVANPLFENRAKGRDPSMVHVLGVVGVPWQDIAVDQTDSELHFRSPDDLVASNTWDEILGDWSSVGGSPTDVHMVESIDPRPGLPDMNAGYMADPIHGHERNIPRRDDLQYACIFDRPTSEPCTDYNCNCYAADVSDDNPICQNASGEYEHVEHFARAYPSLRELSVIKKLGSSGSVASICPRQLSDTAAQDYGYKPAVEALVAELGKNVK